MKCKHEANHCSFLCASPPAYFPSLNIISLHSDSKDIRLVCMITWVKLTCNSCPVWQHHAQRRAHNHQAGLPARMAVSHYAVQTVRSQKAQWWVETPRPQSVLERKWKAEASHRSTKDQKICGLLKGRGGGVGGWGLEPRPWGQRWFTARPFCRIHSTPRTSGHQSGLKVHGNGIKPLTGKQPGLKMQWKCTNSIRFFCSSLYPVYTGLAQALAARAHSHSEHLNCYIMSH